MFKMAPTKQQKAFCAVEYAKTTSIITVQCNFRRQFEVDPPDKNSIKRWHTQLIETGCLCKGKSTGHCLCIAYVKSKAPDIVFAYSTAQNAFCCLVGAILNILCPREQWVFQSILGVSSGNQCNLHHSPHTGHLEKKNHKKRVQSFSDTVYKMTLYIRLQPLPSSVFRKIPIQIVFHFLHDYKVTPQIRTT